MDRKIINPWKWQDIIILSKERRTKMDEQELALRFTYFAPKNEPQIARHEKARESGYHFAMILNAICPESRELSLAITKIEEAVMFANAAIARRED
jgi:hypothetical protein